MPLQHRSYGICSLSGAVGGGTKPACSDPELYSIYAPRFGGGGTRRYKKHCTGRPGCSCRICLIWHSLGHTGHIGPQPMGEGAAVSGFGF